MFSLSLSLTLTDLSLTHIHPPPQSLFCLTLSLSLTSHYLSISLTCRHTVSFSYAHTQSLSLSNSPTHNNSLSLSLSLSHTHTHPQPKLHHCFPRLSQSWNLKPRKYKFVSSKSSESPKMPPSLQIQRRSRTSAYQRVDLASNSTWDGSNLSSIALWLKKEHFSVRRLSVGKTIQPA